VVSLGGLALDGVTGWTYGALLGRLVGGGLVVPVLKVLVDGRLLGVGALGEHGGDATAGLGRLAVHGLVEGGIAVVVLALEVGGGGGNHVEGFAGLSGGTAAGSEVRALDEEANSGNA